MLTDRETDSGDNITSVVDLIHCTRHVQYISELNAPLTIKCHITKHNEVPHDRNCHRQPHSNASFHSQKSDVQWEKFALNIVFLLLSG